MVPKHERSPALPPLSPQEEIEQRIIPTRKEAERLSAKIEVDPTTKCWLWQGAKSSGYGTFHFRGKMRKAHCVSYMIFNGFYPEGTETDHLCEQRACCNPNHLEATTHRINTLRGRRTIPAKHAGRTECPAGHPYSDENTYLSAGKRSCRTCMNAANLRHYAEHREEEKAKRRERWKRLGYGEKYKQRQHENYLRRREKAA